MISHTYAVEELFPAVIDSSMRVDFNSCWHKGYLRHICGLAPVSVNIHLNAGGAYAKGLETFRHHFYSGQSDFETARAHGLLALLISYGDPDFDPAEAKQWHRIVDAYLSYLSHWGGATDYLLPLMVMDTTDHTGQKKRPAVEFSFAIPIENLKHPDTGEPILYTGRFDMLGVMNDVLFCVDDKTTSRLGSTWAQQWDLRSQFTGYCWAAQQYNYPVAGAIIRGTAILKTQITHAEAIVYRPQWMLEQWYERLVRDVEQLIDRYECRQFPHNGQESGACAHYSGCSYRTLCGTNRPLDWIEGNFEVYRWNPMSKD